LHPEARPLPAVTAACADLESVTVLVGPEGDFSGQEYAAIFAADYVPVSLGPLVLKVDTACVALLAGVFAARA